MPKITYTNELGESVIFSDQPPFILESIEGLAGVDADIQTQKAPYQDGETKIDTLLEPRYITMTVTISHENIDECRRYLSSVMNPKLEGMLIYEDEFVTRQIECTNEHVPRFTDKTQNSHRAIIDLIAPNPYWKSPSITEEPAFEGLFQFPFEGEFQMGIQRDERIIYNDGDAPAPINVIFYGPAQTPTIANLTTGEFIKINKSLGENEKLIIDTSDDNKSVYFEDENGNRINVFHWIDLDSTFFKLQVGENEISCMCATSNLSKDFEIYYHKLYIAV